MSEPTIEIRAHALLSHSKGGARQSLGDGRLYSISGKRGDLLAAAVRAAEIDPESDSLWTYFLSEEFDLGIILRVTGAPPKSFFVASSDSTLGQLSDYFGPLLDEPDLAFEILPAEGIGAGPGDIFWETFSPALDAFRLGLEIYGGLDAARQAVSLARSKKARSLREDVLLWVFYSELTPRLEQLVQEKERWDIHKLAMKLDLGPADLGRLLRECGFETSRADPTIWMRVRA